ncbi:serine hydrolase [Streptomyces sp. XY332]|uniref:serine hydrolase n=1 Tax=Streptomyces sp. XY332 TaxID=1415561 RepID=UPI0006B1859C|nr:serine hydrolase [Streptomyces sp. XY332]KOY54211.1 hypothetical protein ADK59_31560 [Streptomyces sp. XY332]
MTLQSDHADAAEPADTAARADVADAVMPADGAERAGGGRAAATAGAGRVGDAVCGADLADPVGAVCVAERVRDVVQGADPDAVWAFGGPGGVHGGTAGDGSALDVGGLVPVLALWPVIGSLVAENELRLHTPLAAYGVEAEPGVTTHHLLSHSTGPVAHAALTRLAEHLTGSPLAELAATRIWHPLGMTGTRFADGTLRAPLADLGRFLVHLVSPVDHPVSRAWITESLRIRTGELTPSRGLLWHPSRHGTWSYGEAPAVWVSPRLHRWAILLPTHPPGPLRQTFRDAAFAPTPSP